MMHSLRLLFIAGCLCPFLAFAEGPPVDEADRGALVRFVELVEKGKREEAADLLSYPIRRENPLPPVRTKQEFLTNYDSFFNPATVGSLVQLAKEKDKIWSNNHGATLDGALWADGGKITAINVSTIKQKKLAAEALKLEKRNTHSSVDNYQLVEITCDTPSHRVRVQKIGEGNFRYVSWRANEKLSSVPELVIEKGNADLQGTVGGGIYRFKDGKTTYEVVRSGIRAQDQETYLQITEGKKPAVKEACAKQ